MGSSSRNHVEPAFDNTTAGWKLFSTKGGSEQISEFPFVKYLHDRRDGGFVVYKVKMYHVGPRL